MLLDSIEGVKKVVEGRSLYTLWTKYGKWESEGSSLFEERAVQREIGPHQTSLGVDVPASYFVLKLSEEDRSACFLAVSSILIRDEYRQALDDICYFATHNALPPLQQDRAYSTEIENPFFNTVPSNITAAVTLLGHPGIGKSLWQFFVLVLRILAGHPTIYYFQPNIFYVFNADGLYEVDLRHKGLQSKRAQFHDAISSEYWCLVDSNRNVPDVPPFLSYLRAFIVQSASPRKDRSLSELIMGRTLQAVAEPCSEADLETFYSQYAPSARSAYTYALQRRLSDYDDMVQEEIGSLNFATVAEMLSAGSNLGTEKVSHLVFLVSPQSDRRRLEISIPTRYIYTMLRDHLHITTLLEVSKLYQIFVCNSLTKVPAGHIFEDVHDLFCKGGQCQVTRLTQNPAGSVNTHFKSPTANAKSSYMCLGYKGHQVKMKSRERPETTAFVPLVRRRYLLGQSITLENAYYQPAPGQPTFDAFIYDQASKTATMLQMTVATEHDVKTKGVEWLGDQGVENFRLVAVIPPDTPIDLPVPNTLVSLITKAYNLVLEDIL